MSEQSQERILERLLQWKDEICESFQNTTTLFLLLGNAMELFGKYIQREDGSQISGIGAFDIYAQRHAPNRFNTLIQAEFEGMTLLGYTSRFSDTYGISEQIAMSQVTIGTGSAPKSKLEGIYVGQVIGTYLLGPLLVANPDFTKWLLCKLGVETPTLPNEQALYQSYEYKRKEFLRPDLALD